MIRSLHMALFSVSDIKSVTKQENTIAVLASLQFGTLTKYTA
jgi:hypothetical protein